MKHTKLSLTLISLCLCSFTFAQDYAFKVLANKGSNEVKSGDSWQPIKTGASLKLGDEIKVSSNAYVGLVHVTGKPLEVKEAKVYTVEELAKKISGGSSVVTKYSDFILSSNSAESKKNKLSATGAVHRDIGKSQLQLHLPENQNSALFNNKAIISWEGSTVPGPYVVVFKNMFDDEVSKLETSETSFILDFGAPEFAKEDKLLVQVMSKTDSREVSKQHLIKKLSTVDHQNVKKELDIILNDVNEPTALNKLILAGFYEENKLLIDAITSYEEAIRLAPDVADYKDAYEEFLLRHNISK